MGMKNNMRIGLENVEKFSLYLYHKHGIDSILKMQKMLFFLRVYEKKNDIKPSPIFNDTGKNFQAWMYGPVNVVSYHFMRLKLYSNEQESNDDVLIELDQDEKNGKFEKYKPIIDNLKKCDSQELVELSHHNCEYKYVRKGCTPFDPCKTELDENNARFTTFDDNESNDKVDKILCIPKK